eukprot:5034556-Prorocentrum_lima.AAC.1
MVQPTHEVIGMIEALFPHEPEEVDTWEQIQAAVKSIPARKKYICKEAHVRGFLTTTKASAAPGPSGWRNTYIQVVAESIHGP